MEPREALVSHEEPNGNRVIKVSASHLLLLHTCKALSGSGMCSESLKSDFVPLLSVCLCLHRRSNEEENWRKGSLWTGVWWHSWWLKSCCTSAVAETKYWFQINPNRLLCLLFCFFWLRLKAVTLKDDGRWAVVPDENRGYLRFADPGVISWEISPALTRILL